MVYVVGVVSVVSMNTLIAGSGCVETEGNWVNVTLHEC